MDRYDVVVNKLTEQIAQLSKESAIYYSLFVKEKQITEQLRKELEELKSKDE